MDWITENWLLVIVARPDGAGRVVADAVVVAAVAGRRVAAGARGRRAVGVEAARGDGAAGGVDSVLDLFASRRCRAPC